MSTNTSYELKVIYEGVEYIGRGLMHKSMLENIENMNIPIMSACRRGNCGLCEVELVSGELDPERSLVVDDCVRTCSSYLQGDGEVFIDA